jgi:hypothetical protein
MAVKFSGLLFVGFVATMVVVPYMMAEARYLPTRGNEDRLTRLKELLTDVSDFTINSLKTYTFNLYIYIYIYIYIQNQNAHDMSY